MRLLVVGIDGLDARLCKEWQAKLPMISSFFKSGSVRSVVPTMPPITPVSWATVHTGTNPRSKRRQKGHGVLGFTKRPGVPFTLEDAGHPTLWELIGDDYTVGVLHMPMLVPIPQFFGGKVNGFVIGDRPLSHWVGKGVQTGRTVWPGDLAEIAAEIPCWPVDIEPEYAKKIGPAKKMALGLDLWEKVEQRRCDGVKTLLENGYQDIEVLAVGSSVVDRMSHVAHHLGEGWRGRMLPAFKIADRLMARLYEEHKPETMMLVSDHGVSPTPGGKMWGHSRHAIVAGLGREFGKGWVQSPPRSVACFAPTVMQVLGIPKQRWAHMEGQVATELFVG